MEMVRIFLLSQLELQTYQLMYQPLVFDHRPTTSAGQWLAPSELPEYCISRQLSGPHCLCSIAQSPSNPLACEALLVRLTINGPHFGEYVAKCFSCSYFGQFEANPLRTKFGLLIPYLSAFGTNLPIQDGPEIHGLPNQPDSEGSSCEERSEKNLCAAG